MPRKPKEKKRNTLRIRIRIRIKIKIKIRIIKEAEETSNYARLKPVTARVLQAGYLYYWQKEGCRGWCPHPRPVSAGSHLPYCSITSSSYLLLRCFNASCTLDFPAWLQMGCRLGYRAQHHLCDPKYHFPCAGVFWGHMTKAMCPPTCVLDKHKDEQTGHILRLCSLRS